MITRVLRGRFGIIAVGIILLGWTPATGGASTTFSVFHSEQETLPVRFEYPADWKVERSTGSTEAYEQVQLYGPSTLDPRLRAYLVVRAVPPAAQGGRYAGLHEMIVSYQQTLLPTLQVEERRAATVAGLPATVLRVSGTMLLPWKSANSQPVPVASERVFVERNGWLFELAWMSTKDAAPAVEPLFVRLVETFTLQ